MNRVNNPTLPSPTTINNSQLLRFSGSVITQTQQKISATKAEARNETIENIGFTLGERMKSIDIDREEGAKKTKVDLRESLYEITKTLPVDTDMQQPFFKLENAMKMFSSTASLKRHLLSIFGGDAGMVAIVIQAYQQKKRRKKILSDILDDLIAEFGEDSSIVLFSALQFGSASQATKSKLKKLYTSTAREFFGITDFYKKLKQKFKDANDRKKAVITMLHSFAEDVHDVSEGLFKIKIVYVIRELKRLSTILSMDAACAEAAEFMQHLDDQSMQNINGEIILNTIIEWMDVAWIYDGMIHEKIASLYLIPFSSQIIFLQKILRLLKSLPVMCYESEESRSHVFDTIQKELNRISTAEETA